MLDKQTKSEIAQVVNEAIQRAFEKADERWVSGKELSDKCQMFTPTWLKIHGHLLPRTQAVIVDENGKEHTTGWVYPLRKILHMIAENKMKFIIPNQRQDTSNVSSMLQ